MRNKNTSSWIYLISAALAVLTIAAFWPVLANGFIQFFDDGSYIVRNAHVQEGLTAKSVVWALTTTYNANWHPLTWVSHMLDFELYGLDPKGSHSTNLLLHALNAILLFLLLNRITKSQWKSAFVAALFAVHPLHVESVAWAAERKDVLSTFLWLTTMWAYVFYSERRSALRYSLVLVSFVLGLMSKPMLVTLPLVLVLMDYWPLRGWAQRRRLVMEKIPLLALSGASCVITYVAQQKGGAVGSFQQFPLGVRAANALVACVAYVGKMLWPINLAVLYPHPGRSLPVWEVIAALLTLTGITALVIRLAGRYQYLAFGWLWYVITLIPVVGLVQVGTQAIADRYTYVSLIGLFVVIAWGVPDILRSTGLIPEVRPSASNRTRSSRLEVRGPELDRACSPLLAGAAGAVLAVLAALTWVQAGCWKDDVTLFQHGVSVTKDNYTLQGNLAAAYMSRRDYGKALDHLSAAVRIKPDAADIRGSYGTVLLMTGHIDEAVRQLSEALRLDPKLTEFRANLESAVESQKESGGAKSSKYEAAVALFNQAVVLDGHGDTAQAVKKYREAIRLAPTYAEPYCNLARAMYSQGQTDQAIALCRTAVRLKPDFGFAHNSLAIFLFVRKQYAESWHEIHEADKHGTSPSPDFVRLLSSKMPDPGR